TTSGTARSSTSKRRCSAADQARPSSPIPTSLRSPALSAPPASASTTSTISPPLWPRRSGRPAQRCSSCASAYCRRGSYDTRSMRRPVRGFGIAFACVLRSSSLGAEAQSPTALKRVALLVPAVWDPTHPQIVAFQQRMRELGYVEGRNVLFDVRGGSADQ